MKGILKLNEKNQYGIYDAEGGCYENLSNLINYFRNDEVKIHIKVNNVERVLNGQISSRRRFKGIYDTFVGKNVDELENENKNDFENGTNLTELLFNNVGRNVEINIKSLKEDK